MPAGALVGLAILEAWPGRGSINGADWLPYAIVAALVLAATAASGAAFAASRRLAVAATCLLGLAAWDAISLTWSASPARARDEALLTALYAAVLVTPALALGGGRDARAAVALLVVGALGGTAVATGIELVRAGSVDDVYLDRRLDFPISYSNAQAAMFLVGLWPGLALAARRNLPPVVRALALSAAAGLGGGWLLTQSKGGAFGLAVSTVVVFAASSQRLRLVVPFALVAAASAAAFVPLTAPYRSNGLAAIHRAGWAELGLCAAGFAAGLAYALLDHRIEVRRAVAQRTGRAAGALIVVAAAAAIAVFAVHTRDPVDFFAAEWQSFKHVPKSGVAGSHFAELGSNRYDFWRVGLRLFARHPLAGIGSRGFRDAYLEVRRSGETPARAHSVELDALSETGIVGFLLLAAGLGLAAWAFARRARDDLVAAGVLGAFACWLAHASVDWIWTFPAVCIPLLVLVGAASTRDDETKLRTRSGVAVAAAAVALAVGGFGVPWLANRYVRTALATGDTRQLARARSLDPLSTDPLLAAWALARTPRAGVAPLLEAVRKEPRSPDLLYALGRQQLLVGDKRAARATLRHALRLDPREPALLAALRRASG